MIPLKSDAKIISTFQRMKSMYDEPLFTNEHTSLAYAMRNYDHWPLPTLVRYLDEVKEKLELPWEFRRIKRLEQMSPRRLDEHYACYLNFMLAGAHRQFEIFKAVLRELKIALPSNATVLEVGCGRGGFMANFMNMFPNRIVGVDMDRSSLLINSKLQETIGHSNYELYAQYGQNLPFEDHSFDLVVSFDVLEHVGNAEAKRCFLSELKRVCKGTMIVYCPNRLAIFNPESHVRFWYLGFFPRRLGIWLVQQLRKMPYADIEPPTLFQLKRLLGKVNIASARIFPYQRFSKKRIRFLLSNPLGRVFASGYVAVAQITAQPKRQKEGG